MTVRLPMRTGVGVDAADGLVEGFDGPHAATTRTPRRASDATAGRRPRRGSVRGDMGGIVARSRRRPDSSARCRSCVSLRIRRADIAFLIGSLLLHPQCGVLSVGHGRTRNGSIPPSQTGSADWAGAPGLFSWLASAATWMPTRTFRHRTALTLLLQGAAADTSAVNVRRRATLLVGATIVAALAIAIPVMGADPSPSGGPARSDEARQVAEPEQARQGGEDRRGTRGPGHRPGHRHQGHGRERSPDLQRHAPTARRGSCRPARAGTGATRTR